ncbi:MAG: TonB-dependent receptor plug domain-containing protein [Caulobacterales bacterium]
MRPQSIASTAFAIAGGALSPLAAPALADPPPTPVSEVIVTRLPTQLSDAPDVVVIDRSQIDARQAIFAADILDTVPGLALTRDGAFGGVASVRMRGASADKTLVLIDGVPQNDASNPSGTYDFSNLDLADIERVEILSGPQAALWGSSAIGGVIAFTTREQDGWRAALEGGSLSTFDGSAGYGRRTDRWAYGATVSGYRSDGVSKADGLGGPDPYWNWNAGAYGRLRLTPALSLDARLRYTDSYAAVDGFDAATFAFGDTPQVAASRAWNGLVRATLNGPMGFTDTLSVGLYGLSRTDTYYRHPEDSSHYWADRQDYRLTAERGAAADAFGLVVGVERENDRADISTGQALDLGATSAFLVGRARPWSPLTVTGAIRYDAPDSYRGQITGRASAVVRLGAGFLVEGAWGQGFKTPTISEIACDFCFPGGPSVGLRPERAEGWDAGLAWASSDGRLSGKVTAYQLSVHDQIEFAPTFPFRYVNIDRTRTNGVEAQADARLTAHLTAQLGYAYTDAVDLSAHTQMLRTPRNSGSFSLLWNDGRWQGAFTLRSEGPDADIDPASFAPATRPGFVLASLAGAYALRPGLQITGRVENLAAQHYQEALGYGEPRRMIFLGVRVER